MKCSTCGQMNCYAHGGEVEHHSDGAGGSANRSKGAARVRNESRQMGVHKSQNVHVPGSSQAGYSARGASTYLPPGGDKEKFNSDAKDEHKKVIKESRSLPKPKLKGLAHGGEVKGVHRESYTRDEAGSESGDAVRDAHAMKRGSPKMREGKLESAREEHRRILNESKSMPNPKLKGLAHGGEVDMYAMKPDVPAMHGMSEGGEMDDDNELMDMAAGELMEALEKKDKKQILEAIKAIVLSCGE